MREALQLSEAQATRTSGAPATENAQGSARLSSHPTRNSRMPGANRHALWPAPGFAERPFTRPSWTPSRISAVTSRAPSSARAWRPRGRGGRQPGRAPAARSAQADSTVTWRATVAPRAHQRVLLPEPGQAVGGAPGPPPAARSGASVPGPHWGCDRWRPIDRSTLPTPPTRPPPGRLPGAPGPVMVRQSGPASEPPGLVAVEPLQDLLAERTLLVCGHRERRAKHPAEGQPAAKAGR